MRAIVAILQAAGSLTTLLADGSNGVFLDEAEQGDNTPYVVVDIADIDPLDSIESATTTDEFQVRVFAISDRHYTSGALVGAYEVSEEVRTALDRVKGTYATDVISSISFQSCSTFLERNGGNKRVVYENIYTVYKQR